MATGFFGDIAPISYEGATSENPLAYRYYDASRVVMGKTMAEHLRPAVCYWHNFAWGGSDMFGSPTFERPWFAETMAAARLKADVAFEMFTTLGVPFFSFHDRDVVPEGANQAEFQRNLAEITEYFAGKMKDTGVKLLWGTANLFSHPRFMSGAATNPDPDVFAYAAAQVKSALDATHKLEGRELRALGRARGLRDAAQHGLEARAQPDGPLSVDGGRLQASHRLQGHDPDRAQAAGADKAPIRLRRRDRLRVPAKISVWRRR